MYSLHPTGLRPDLRAINYCVYRQIAVISNIHDYTRHTITECPDNPGFAIPAMAIFLHPIFFSQRNNITIMIDCDYSRGLIATTDRIYYPDIRIIQAEKNARTVIADRGT